MVMPRPGQNPHLTSAAPSEDGAGPVFLPRRKPSALAETLLAELRQDVTSQNDPGAPSAR